MKKNRLAPRSFSEAGFTLIEMIVVISVLAITLPSIFAIVFGIARQQTKIFRISKVKEEGDYIFSLIGSTIRNRAVSIHSSSTADDSDEVCKNPSSTYTSTANSLYFRDLLGDRFSYSISDDAISSSSATTINLNSGKVKFSGYSIGCAKGTNSYSTPVVTVKFTISYNTDSSRTEDTASLTYQTRVKLRN